MAAPTADGYEADEYGQEYLDRGTDRLGLHIYPDPDDRRGPVVLVWPAMGVPARYYRWFRPPVTRSGARGRGRGPARQRR